MISVNQRQRGFTIVELLIVLIVVGILVGLVLSTFTGIRKREHDTERQNDIKVIYGQVEAYFAQYAKYPTLANMNDATWRATNMKVLDNDSLKDPRGKDAKLADKPGPNVYSYEVKAADGSDCDNVKKDCAKYTLTATRESGGVVVQQNSN